MRTWNRISHGNRRRNDTRRVRLKSRGRRTPPWQMADKNGVKCLFEDSADCSDARLGPYRVFMCPKSLASVDHGSVSGDRLN